MHLYMFILTLLLSNKFFKRRKGSSLGIYILAGTKRSLLSILQLAEKMQFITSREGAHREPNHELITSNEFMLAQEIHC